MRVNTISRGRGYGIGTQGTGDSGQLAYVTPVVPQAVQATSEAQVHAWCWASGLIEIGPCVPAAAIGICVGPQAAVRRRLEVCARHGLGASDGQLLVPGIPEANTLGERLNALHSWLVWCASGGENVTWHALKPDWTAQ